MQNNHLNSKVELGFKRIKMYNFKVCTTVFYTLGYICAMESPRGENDIYMRRHDVKRKSGMNAVNGVRKLPDLYWNTSNPM